MSPENFCYWLQGYFEIENKSNSPKKIKLTEEQVEVIEKHLQLVFSKTYITTSEDLQISYEDIQKSITVKDAVLC